ncbi:MAG: HlyD family secretion protein [Reyranella sp.]|uniref:HlyD family secretion protein n=1 Tax=Reyranella sp. TaxID=1929291 RepID=UPI0011FA1AA2|nr:HlyD family secretion protein [Reyranella sp.]TAJ86912.1 MAG: HlyD family secretion protein [Reyranella sp.]TBR28977.1 MAG: HlyD family secretion protein [Reyranella sp.]
MANRSSFRRSDLADEVSGPAGANAEPRPRPRNLRRILLVLGPAVVLAGSLFAYMTGGRYVSTDNAYVHAGKLTVATDVSGIVAKVDVHESQKVEKGQVLFTLDQEPFRIALAGAEANLGTVRNQIVTQQATYRQKLAQIEQAKTDIGFYETAAQRQQDLLKRGVSAQATYDQAKRDLDTARERLLVAQHDAEAALAQLGGRADAPIEQNPNYLAAQAQVDKARRDLTRTTVVAPMPGIVTNVDALLPGEYLPAAQPAFSLVSTQDVWVEANPKESDLANLKPGDKATVSIDAYPGREWQATVTSLAPATGAEFSVLPAQNATGNWVKVVQRVPIRLNVEMPQGAPPLRTGMSAYVEIDTGHHRQLRDLFSGF